MSDYLTEQEQIEILKNWIKQYAGVILGGIVLAVVIMSGWRYWEQRQNNILNRASSMYDEMISMRAQNDSNGASEQAKKLYAEYPQTVYGKIAALIMAHDNVNNKNYDAAKEELNWVIDNTNTKSFKQIARLRLARVQETQHQFDQALETLKTIDDESFNALIYEERGDIYFEMKKTDLARQAYKDALAELPNAETVRPTLQMKYDNLST